MPIAWFIVPYKRHPDLPRTRYPAIDDFTPEIYAWSETEVLGDIAIVKINADGNILAQLNNEPGYERLPKGQLKDGLGDVPPGQLKKWIDLMLEQGYSQAEIDAEFPDGLKNYTMEDMLNFMATRRLKPRWVPETDEILIDGEEQTPKPVAIVDAEVQE